MKNVGVISYINCAKAKETANQGAGVYTFDTDIYVAASEAALVVINNFPTTSGLIHSAPCATVTQAANGNLTLKFGAFTGAIQVSTPTVLRVTT